MFSDCTAACMPMQNLYPGVLYNVYIIYNYNNCRASISRRVCMYVSILLLSMYNMSRLGMHAIFQPYAQTYASRVSV